MPNLSLFLKGDKLQKSQCASLEILLKITGAKTSAVIVGLNYPILTAYDASSNLTTAGIDAFLGISSDIAGDTCYDATSLGADSFGLVINCEGGMQKAFAMHYEIVTTAGGTPAAVSRLVQASSSQLTSSATDALANSPAGNIYLRVAGVSNLDAGTAGHMKFVVYFDPK